MSNVTAVKTPDGSFAEVTSCDDTGSLNQTHTDVKVIDFAYVDRREDSRSTDEPKKPDPGNPSIEKGDCKPRGQDERSSNREILQNHFESLCFPKVDHTDNSDYSESTDSEESCHIIYERSWRDNSYDNAAAYSDVDDYEFGDTYEGDYGNECYEDEYNREYDDEESDTLSKRCDVCEGDGRSCCERGYELEKDEEDKAIDVFLEQGQWSRRK
jgi:hypothetical protein